MDDLKSAQWWVAKGSSIGLTGMSMLRSAEGNGRQAREPNMASKACLASSAQPAAQNACAANPAAGAEAAQEAMDVDGVHADASLPASPSLHAVSMPAIHTLHGLQARVEAAILRTLPLCAACKP